MGLGLRCPGLEHMSQGQVDSVWGRGWLMALRMSVSSMAQVACCREEQGQGLIGGGGAWGTRDLWLRASQTKLEIQRKQVDLKMEAQLPM